MPPLTREEMEINSIKYSNAVLIIIPISQGRIAILDRGFNLHQIRDTPPTVSEIQSLSTEFAQSLKRAAAFHAESKFLGEPDIKTQVRDLRKANKQPKPSLDFLDLDLDL